MAELAFVDTHFHLHDMKHPSLRYGWLEPDAVHGFLPDTDPLKAQRYRIKDYIAEIRFANVPKAIHVQAAVGTPEPVDETAWLQAFADETGYPHGIVAECHLARRTPRRFSTAICKFANVRGIRDFGEGNYLVDPAWRRGFAELAPRNLVYCLDTRIERAGDVLDLAQEFPETHHLRRPLRHPDGARRGLLPPLAGGDRRDGEGPERHHEGLGARHVRPAVDGRIAAALRARRHRDVRRRPRRLRHQLAGRPHVQFLPGPHERLCRDHLRLSARRATRNVLRQCRTHIPISI